MKEWINDNGNIFSFIGLLLTILTFIGVLFNKRILNRLNRRNFKINRMPENLQDLKQISNTISLLLADFNNKKREIKIEVSKISPVLKSLKKSLDGNDLEFYNNLNKSIKLVDNWEYEGEKRVWYKNLFNPKQKMTEVIVSEVDIKLTRLITDIENIDKDNKKNLLA